MHQRWHQLYSLLWIPGSIEMPKNSLNNDISRPSIFFIDIALTSSFRVTISNFVWRRTWRAKNHWYCSFWRISESPKVAKTAINTDLFDVQTHFFPKLPASFVPFRAQSTSSY